MQPLHKLLFSHTTHRGGTGVEASDQLSTGHEHIIHSTDAGPGGAAATDEGQTVTSGCVQKKGTYPIDDSNIYL